MGVFRSTDPNAFDDVDGIIVNESAPTPNVQGVAANIALIVGQTERGLQGVTEVGSIGEFHEIFGKSSSFGVNLALKNKKFGRLRVMRVVAAAAVQASKTFEDGDENNIITFKAKQGKGAFGNNIQVKIEAGSTSGKKYTIKDTTTGGVMLQEVFDNVAIASASTAFADSELIEVTVVATTAEPANIAFTALESGADGTVADTDYQTALGLAEVEGAANIVFLDAYNATRNGYLKTHAANTQDRMVVCAGAEGDSAADAITAVASLRDTDGRIIYAFNHVQTSIDGSLVYQSPAHWIASILSQLPPHKDPAAVESVAFMAGATGLKLSLSRTNYISLKEAGICAFEIDNDIGIKPKSGITTQIADSSKLTILRRRMADYLTASVAKFLKNFQNAVNSKANRTLVKGSILAFVQRLENEGILPKDSDLSEGKAKLVDTESLNTNNTIAQGYFKILWRQRIHSSMRFIVLTAEIGEDVTVTEGE
jgi:hypothetical protein